MIEIRALTPHQGLMRAKESFKKNKIHYLQEALGLAIFMISACFFATELESNHGFLHAAIPNADLRRLCMGIFMGATALFIFYSPFTSPSGSHINPAVSVTFFRLGKMCVWDMLFYIVFQFAGGLLAVELMMYLLGPALTGAPVRYVVTTPGNFGVVFAALTEFIIAFLMMSMVLLTSMHKRSQRFTRVIAACMVCIYVTVAGPLSGFGMNPARSFASAIPSGIYTAWWIYLFIPFAGMLTAAEFFLLNQKYKSKKRQPNSNTSIMKSVFIILCFCSYSLIAEAQVKRVESVIIPVKNLKTAVQFYTGVLHFQEEKTVEYSGEELEKVEGLFGVHLQATRLRLGDECIDLVDYLTAGGRSIPEDSKCNDLSFQHIAIVVSDMEQAYAELRKNNVEFVSTAPQTLPFSNPAAGGIKAFYFHDPDDHTLELIWFPNGKGQPKWHQGVNAVFLGIDHTAIGISNSTASLKFYQEILGVERKGESFNFGTEQEHLNNVEGASLHITGLRTPAGPGIEFLEYLKPGPGKPYPINTRADDIWCWQTVIQYSGASKLYEQLKNNGFSFLSTTPGRISWQQTNPSFSFIVKDPDGHAVLITEASGK